MSRHTALLDANVLCPAPMRDVLMQLALTDIFRALRKVRARLKNPHHTAEDYLATLTQQGLVATAAELEQFKELI